uniref:RNA helicase n=1 Tax=Globodera rostochiensis TaxID=31243 RepID=A0A914I8U5_GLORO
MHRNNEKQVQERLLQLKEFLSNAKLKQTAIFRRLQNSLVEFEADLACTQSETTSMVEEALMLLGETGNVGSVPFVGKDDALLKSTELPVVALTGEEDTLRQKVQAQIAVNNNAEPSSPKLSVTDRCAEKGATFRKLVDFFMKEPLCQSGQTSLNDTYTASSQKMDNTNCREKEKTEFEKIVEEVEPFDHQTAPSKSERADGQKEVKTSLMEMVKAQLEKKSSCNSANDATYIVLSPKFGDGHSDKQENKLKKAVAEHMAATHERNGERVPSVSVASAGDEQRTVPPPEKEAENFGQTRTTSATSFVSVEENIAEVEDDPRKQNEKMPQTEGAVDGLQNQIKDILDIELARLFSEEDLGAVIRKMGGQVWSAVDQKFTHLIAVKCDPNSDKYKEARRHKLPVVLPSWVYAAAGAKDMETLNSVFTNEFLNVHKTPLFAECEVSVSGFLGPERIEIGRLVASHGGIFNGAMSRSSCTHLISATNYGEKYRRAREWGSVKVVTSRWLHKSIEMGYRLPEERFVFGKDGAEQRRSSDDSYVACTDHQKNGSVKRRGRGGRGVSTNITSNGIASGVREAVIIDLSDSQPSNVNAPNRGGLNGILRNGIGGHSSSAGVPNSNRSFNGDTGTTAPTKTVSFEASTVFSNRGRGVRGGRGSASFVGPPSESLSARTENNTSAASTITSVIRGRGSSGGMNGVQANFETNGRERGSDGGGHAGAESRNDGGERFGRSRGGRNDFGERTQRRDDFGERTQRGTSANGGGGGGERFQQNGSRPPPHVYKKRNIDEIFAEDIRAKEKYADIRSEDEDLSFAGKQQTFESYEKWTDFDLESKLLENINHCMYVLPRKIQSCTFPLIREGYDVKAHAETSSGKSAAFLLPIVDKLMKLKKKPVDKFVSKRGCPYAVVVSPLRELAIQLYEQARKLSNECDVSVSLCYGGFARHINMRNISVDGCDILIGTPGRLYDFFHNKYLMCDNLKVYVLDEADELLDDKFVCDLRALESVPNWPKIECRQNLLFSATFPIAVQRWADEWMRRDSLMITVGQISPNRRIRQNFVMVDGSVKKQVLLRLLQLELEQDKTQNPTNPKLRSTMVFVNSRNEAEIVANFLSLQGMAATTINGGRDQALREKAIWDFRTGQFPIIVTTDVCARGHDIKNLDRVINLDLPSENSAEDSYYKYVQRIGRTGRIQMGMATSFFDQSMDMDLLKLLIGGMKFLSQAVPSWMQQALDDGFLQGQGSSLSDHNLLSNAGIPPLPTVMPNFDASPTVATQEGGNNEVPEQTRDQIFPAYLYKGWPNQRPRRRTIGPVGVGYTFMGTMSTSYRVVALGSKWGCFFLGYVNGLDPCKSAAPPQSSVAVSWPK